MKIMTATDKLSSRIRLILAPWLRRPGSVSDVALLDVEDGGAMAVGRPVICVVHGPWVNTDGLKAVGLGGALLSIRRTSGVSLRTMAASVAMIEGAVVVIVGY